MRRPFVFGMLILGVACIMAITPNLTNGQGRKGGGFPGGGGFGKGGGGFGGPGGAATMMARDAETVFDMYAKGRSFFLISDTRSLAQPLTQYAQEKGIRNGQITRSQYIDFHTQYKAKLNAGGGAAPPVTVPFAGGSFGGPGMFKMGKKGFGGGDPSAGGPPQSADAINQQADSLFQRIDKNSDGKLNQDEMPGSLRAALDRFDKNRDGLIDQTEFRDYYLARITGDTDPTAGRGSNQIVIDEDELDRKPVVLRAGKLPANMPDWFEKCDLDGDGQVALSEWRKASKKPLDEFQKWDLNDDGFITPEEALKQQVALGEAKPSRGGSMASLDPNADPRAAWKMGGGKKSGDPNAGGGWGSKGMGGNKGMGGGGFPFGGKGMGGGKKGKGNRPPQGG